MKIGCNYSKELIELIEETEVEIDYIKVGAFKPFIDILDEIYLIKPMLIHGFGFFEHAGMDMNIYIDWDEINNTLLRYSSPHLGFHFSIYENDRLYKENEKDIVNNMIKTVKVWKSNLKIPLLIENMDYCPYYKDRLAALEICVKPNVISQACYEANVDLLFDIAHARVSAYHMKINIFEYINMLPLDRIKEIHMTGTQLVKGVGFVDSHLESKDSDYRILEYVLGKANPNVLTLEYGWPGEKYKFRTKKELIKDQLNKLRKMYINI